MKRFMSIMLVVSMLLSLLPTNIMAKEDKGQVTDKSAITVSANAENTITVKEPESEPGSGSEPGIVYDGLLSLTSLNHDIKRDYEQECMIKVENNTNKAIEFYLDIENRYADLSMNIIKAGSKDNPAILASGESVDVELSVFAQNAENEEYVIPVTAYILNDGEYVKDSKDIINLNCDIPVLDLSWTLVSSNEYTLMQTWRITNNGETLTDLCVGADDKLKSYIMFSPVIVNYELLQGASVEVEVWPDLSKMKDESVTTLDGMIIASCAGKTSEQEVVFDTDGQGITVTTMGELALKQNGNPFTKFKLLNESFCINYYNGEEYIPITNQTVTENLFYEDNLFGFEQCGEIDLGIEQTMRFVLCTKSSLINPVEGSSIDLSPKWEFGEDGTISITLYTALSKDDYDAYVNELSTQDSDYISGDSKNAILNASRYIESPVLEDMDYVISTTLLLNDYEKILGVGSDALGHFGDLYDVAKVAIGGDVALVLSSDPRFDETAKVNYNAAYIMKSILSIGTIAVSWANPIVGFAFKIATIPLNGLLDEMQENAFRDGFSGYNQLHYSYKGQQCTNRGRITVPFYVPKYPKDKDKKPKIKSTGRMKDDGFVDDEDTNYDITLNGEDAGSVSDDGLTDVTMADIPTDNLIPGDTNVLDFDYDTDPGHYFVTTDTEITLLYPDDTEIAYIGEPDDLNDVRRKPDFCVYEENIFSSDDLVVGESGKLIFKVYNRGSRGGWFNIVCYENETAIYQEENRYLDAFDKDTVEIDWTPSAESTNVKVELINTSINLDERRTDNNIAMRTINARERRQPVIKDMICETIYEKMPFALIVDVENSEDIATASFMLDGEIQPSEVRLSGQGSNRRYWISFDEGTIDGEHILTAELSYKTSSETESVIKKSFVFSVLEKEWAVPYASLYSGIYLYGTELRFSVYNTKNLIRTELSIDGEESRVIMPETTYINNCDYAIDLSGYTAGENVVVVNIYYLDRDGNEVMVTDNVLITLVSEKDSFYSFALNNEIENPEITVYRYDSMIDCEFEETEPNVYRCRKSLDMYNNPEDYTVVISYSSGVIVSDMLQNGRTLSEDGCNTLIVDKSEKGVVESARIEKVSGVSGKEESVLSTSIDIDTDRPIMVTPGIYQVYITGYYDGVSFYTSCDCDLTDTDHTIDLSSLVLIYYFEIVSPFEHDDYEATIYYKQKDNYWWSSDSMNCDYDKETHILKCYEGYSWTVSGVHDCDEAILIVKSKNELYTVTIKEDVTNMRKSRSLKKEAIPTLDHSQLIEVTINDDNNGWEIGEVDLEWNRMYASLYGKTIYIPAGEYSFSVELLSGNTTMKSETETVVNDDCKVSVGYDLSRYQDVKIEWAEPFKRAANVRCSTTAFYDICAYDFESGNTLKVEEGERQFSFSLYYADREFDICRQYEVGTENNYLLIGNHFDGIITSTFDDVYEGGKTVNINLDEVYDAEGNELNYLYAYGIPMNGLATFVDIEDATRTFTTDFTASNLSNITLKLPNESGVFSLSVEMTTKNAHYVTFNSMGGSDVLGTSVEDGSMVERPIDPERSNYIFRGWFTDENLTASYDFDTPVTEDITLYAKWEYCEEETYVVTFDSIGGSGVESITVVNGDTIDIPYSPSKEGFAFKGWYIDTDYTEAYDFSSPVTENITLYAKWTELFTVTFDTQGGSYIMKEQVLNGDTVNIPKDPTRPNYVFKGWFMDPECKKPYDFTGEVIGNITLYAKWDSIGTSDPWWIWKQLNMTEAVTNFVNRLYKNILRRAADIGGLENWVYLLVSKKITGAKVVYGFVYSPEFLNNPLNNKEFVTVMYRTILGREPDGIGLDSWVKVLEKGFTRKKVLAGFLNSREMKSLCDSLGINSGVYHSDELIDKHTKITDFVSRLYKVCLGREVDYNGLTAWVGALVDGRASGMNVADGFFFSSEMTEMNLSNREFVVSVYVALLGREPDQGGLDYWTGILDACNDRHLIIEEFVNSEEAGNMFAKYGISR